MKALLTALLITAASAQTVKVRALRVSAGASVCTFESREPVALTGLHIECVSASASLKQDTVLTVGAAQTGQWYAGRDSLTWTFQRPAGGPLMYKTTANGMVETGSL